eukprot:m.67428 g.67428  ORF g.67428 m.67428 type:complete len:470 (+) comp23809_c0_seq2:144-1553(+)
MNSWNVDPQSQDLHLLAIEDFLEDGIACTSAFNRKGSLLAVGCNDGRVLVWDFDTKGVARHFSGHVQTVSSVSWSRNGRKLVSASTDWHCIVWDVVSSERIASYKFDGVVLSAMMHPRNDTQFIACLMLSSPVFIDMSKPEAEGRHVYDITEEEIANNSKARGDQGACAVFGHKGEKIYIGTPRGKIKIFNTKTHELIKEFTAATGSACAIKSLAFSGNGDAYIVNCMDRSIRVYSTANDELEHGLASKFMDVVNHVQWKTCCFSTGPATYVIAGSAQEAQHKIYMWDREGGLLRVLEGPKEGLLDCIWHPARQIIVSISTYGIIYIWAVNATENWSAFAPDFKELEDNEEYIEREDEFDYVDESKLQQEKSKDEDGDVDILTVDEVSFGSSDEEPIDDELVYLPVDVLADADPDDNDNTDEADRNKEEETRNDTENVVKKRGRPSQQGSSAKKPRAGKSAGKQRKGST